MEVLRKQFSTQAAEGNGVERERGDRRRATSARSVTSEKGKIKERLGTPSRTQLSRCRQTTMNLVPTQDGEHLEQSRTYCFSRDRYTDRVNQCSRLHTAR